MCMLLGFSMKLLTKLLYWQHIDAALTMLNCKRIEQGTWFNDKGLPKACFVPFPLLEMVGKRYDSIKTPPAKGLQLLNGHVGDVAKGLTYPNKIWLEDVDVIYGVLDERKSSHFIGMEINLMNNTITLFHCGFPKSRFRVDLPQIKQLAGKNSMSLNNFIMLYHVEKAVV